MKFLYIDANFIRMNLERAHRSGAFCRVMRWQDNVRLMNGGFSVVLATSNIRSVIEILLKLTDRHLQK
jgi:hypothetical protein